MDSVNDKLDSNSANGKRQKMITGNGEFVSMG
jgi:hypothetical protein